MIVYFYSFYYLILVSNYLIEVVCNPAMQLNCFATILPLLLPFLLELSCDDSFRLSICDRILVELNSELTFLHYYLLTNILLTNKDLILAQRLIYSDKLKKVIFFISHFYLFQSIALSNFSKFALFKRNSEIFIGLFLYLKGVEYLHNILFT